MFVCLQVVCFLGMYTERYHCRNPHAVLFYRGTGSKGISIWMVPIPAVLHIGAFSMRICKQTGK